MTDVLYARGRLDLLMQPTRVSSRRVAAFCGGLLLSALVAASSANADTHTNTHADAAARPPVVDTPARADASAVENARAARDYARKGLYAQLGLSLGSQSYGWLAALDAETAAAGAAALAMPGLGAVDVGYSSTSFLGFDIGLGYRLARRFAVDASFEWASAGLWADVVERTATQRIRSQRPRGDLETWITTVNGRFYLTTGRLQPFALAGIGAMKATPVNAAGRRDAYGFASRFGGGLDFYLTRHAAATAVVSYVLATGDTGNSDLLSFRASLTWRR